MTYEQAVAALEGVRSQNMYGRNGYETFDKHTDVLRALEALPSGLESAEYWMRKFQKVEAELSTQREEWERTVNEVAKQRNKAEAELAATETDRDRYARDANRAEAELACVRAEAEMWRKNAQDTAARVPAGKREAFVEGVNWAGFDRSVAAGSTAAEAARRYPDPAGEDDYQQHTDMPDPAPEYMDHAPTYTAIDKGKPGGDWTAEVTVEKTSDEGIRVVKETIMSAPMMRCEAEREAVIEAAKKWNRSYQSAGKWDGTNDRLALSEAVNAFLFAESSVCKPVETDGHGFAVPHQETTLETADPNVMQKCTRPNDTKCHAHSGVWCYNGFQCPAEETTTDWQARAQEGWRVEVRDPPQKGRADPRTPVPLANGMFYKKTSKPAEDCPKGDGHQWILDLPRTDRYFCEKCGLFLDEVQKADAAECTCAEGPDAEIDLRMPRANPECPIHGLTEDEDYYKPYPTDTEPPDMMTTHTEEGGDDIVRMFEGEWTREQYDDLRTLAGRIKEPLDNRMTYFHMKISGKIVSLEARVAELEMREGAE